MVRIYGSVMYINVAFPCAKWKQETFSSISRQTVDLCDEALRLRRASFSVEKNGWNGFL